MGKINQGILGGFSGKVGPIVGCQWKSKYYIRAHAAKVSNPHTPQQQVQRGKFATAFNFLKGIKPFIRIGYKESAQEKSAFNAAMSYMLKKAVTGSDKGVTIDYDRVLVSSGSLMPAFGGTATTCKDNISFCWTDNSGMGNAENEDIALLLVYNTNKETAVYDTQAALRSDGQAELRLPTDWQGDELVAYLGFCSADGNYASNSVRMTLIHRNLPSTDRTRSTIEVHSNLDHPSTIRPVGNGILSAVNLRQSLFGSPVKLKFENIDGIP